MCGIYYARVTSSGGTVKENWYDRDGDTVRVDLNGRTVKRVLQDGRNWEVIDEAGRRTRKEYDEWDNLTRVAYPDGSEVTHTYEHTYNRRTSTVNENGVKTKFEYDDSGNLTSRVEAEGTPEERITEYQYNDDGYPILIQVHGTDGIFETQIGFDSAGNVTSVIDPEGNTTTFSYDIAGNILTFTDGRGKVWRFDCDLAGNIVKFTDPLDQERRFEYDGAGLRIKEFDAFNRETSFEYNRKGNLTLSVDPMGNETNYFYDADGNLIRTVDPEGHETTNAYDTDGRMVKMVDGSGNVTTMEYSDNYGACPSCSGNSQDLPSRINFPTFSREFQYDARGRKTVKTDIAGLESLATRYEYDMAGQMVLKTDRKGRTTNYEYDHLGRLILVRNNASVPGNETHYSYDARGNLLSLTDAEGQTTRFEHDGNNRLIREIRPMGRETRYSYDAAGNPIEQVDAKGQKAEYVYDDAGRLIEIQYFASSSAITPAKTVVFTYDPNGNLKSYDDGTTSGVFDYDLAGHKISETVDYGDFSLTYSYSYYKNGAKKSLTYPDGTVVEYAYDSSNKLQAVRIPGVGDISVSEYQWMRPKTVRLPGGGEKSYIYDPLMRVKQITANDPAGNPVMNYQYSYDRMDNITTKATDHGNYDYDYDAMNRLATADNPVLDDEAFTYDSVGNRLTSATSSGTWDYNDNNELQGFDNTTFQYDANGNTLAKIQNGVGQHYIYNLEDRLERVEDDSGNTIASYYYDPFGRRLWKEVSSTRTYFHYSNEGLLGEYDATGAVIKTYGWKPNAIWSTDPLYMQQGSNTYFYHNDHLGTPQKMTTATGAVVWSAQYTALGKADVDPASTVENNLRFAGQYEDVETGLHYNWNRFYDPGTGRYLRVDPIGFAGGDKNLYLYVQNDPVNSIDPSGLINPVKFGVGLINSFRGLKSIVAGVGIIVGGVVTTPVTGGVSGVAASAIGVSQIVLGFANFNRGLQQLREAHCESFDQTSFKNLLGLAPFGQKFDDPLEPTPQEYFGNMYKNCIKDPLNTVMRAIKEFFAFDDYPDSYFDG